MSTLLAEQPQTTTSTGRRRASARGLKVPHGLTSWRFALAVGAVLSTGLVALLAVNTALAAGAIHLRSLERDLARLEEQRQSVEVRVEGMSSPAALQAAAMAAGMVPAPAPVFLDPATGAVRGDLAPAPEPTAPPTQAPQVRPKTPPPTSAPAPGPGAGSDSSQQRPIDPTPDRGLDGAVVVGPGERPPAVQSPTQPAAPDQPGDQASVAPQLPGGDRAVVAPAGNGADRASVTRGGDGAALPAEEAG